MRKGIVLLAVVLLLPLHLQAQSAGEGIRLVSGRKAFVLSLLLPGLGHRYVNNGDWSPGGTLFALADVGAWVSLAGAQWRHDYYVSTYENMAQVHAGAQIEGQSRVFLLNVGQYNSSVEYIDFLLRARAWDRLDTAELPEQQWTWDEEANRMLYRELRSDADRMERRTTWVAAILVGNRIISALSALRAAGKSQSAQQAQFGIAPGDSRGGVRFTMALRW